LLFLNKKYKGTTSSKFEPEAHVPLVQFCIKIIYQTYVPAAPADSLHSITLSPICMLKYFSELVLFITTTTLLPDGVVNATLGKVSDYSINSEEASLIAICC
jgi:hypothetical protein